MLTSELVWALSALEIAAAAVTLLLLLRVVAPYGRHTRPGWGPSLPARWGWVVMEVAKPPRLSFSMLPLPAALLL